MVSYISRNPFLTCRNVQKDLKYRLMDVGGGGEDFLLKKVFLYSGLNAKLDLEQILMAELINSEQRFRTKILTDP